MQHLRTMLVAAASIAALGIAGCGTGDSSGTPPETTSAAPTSEASQGPPIANPKDLSAVKDPCQLLKPDQATQLGTGNPVPDGKSPWGEAICKWSQNDIEVSFSPETTLGGGIAAQLEDEGLSQPDDAVDGYPVLTVTETQTTCSGYVGVSEKQGISVFASTGSDGAAPPCGLLKQAAGMAISNLPPMS